MLNGNAINGLSSGADIFEVTEASVTLIAGDVLTGTLEDGSTFIFSSLALDNLNGINLIQTSTPTLDTTPQTINTASALRSLRVGQSLTVQTGGQLDNNFTAVDATFNVQDGSVGDFVEVARSEFNISNGTVGNDFHTFNSTVNISGGDIGDDFEAFNSAVDISGGTVGDNFSVSGDSTLS